MCIYANSGCNGPIEGECIGLCLHRAHIKPRTTSKGCAADAEQPVVFADREPTAFVAARDAYKTHRARGRLDAIRHALRAFRAAR